MSMALGMVVMIRPRSVNTSRTAGWGICYRHPFLEGAVVPKLDVSVDHLRDAGKYPAKAFRSSFVMGTISAMLTNASRSRCPPIR
jgi:hypothetical protein